MPLIAFCYYCLSFILILYEKMKNYSIASFIKCVSRKMVKKKLLNKFLLYCIYFLRTYAQQNCKFLRCAKEKKNNRKDCDVNSTKPIVNSERNIIKLSFYKQVVREMCFVSSCFHGMHATSSYITYIQ